MDSLADLLRMLLGFLLQFVELLVSFFIAALQLIHQIFNALVGSVS